jgi:hypothetical protein
MDVILYIENLAAFTTEEELKTLFTEVGEVVANEMTKNRINREPNDTDHRLPISTAGTLGQMGTEVTRFSACSLSGGTLRVRLTMLREQRGSLSKIFEP